MLPPGCDQIGCSSAARRSSFGVPLHVVKVSYRAPRFVLDITWSILRQQFVSWVSTWMPIYPDAHKYLKQRRRVLLLCDSCGQYVGACRWPPTHHWSTVSLVLSRLDYASTRRCPACLTTSSVVCSPSCGGKIDLPSPVVGPRNVNVDGTALVECSRLSRL